LLVDQPPWLQKPSSFDQVVAEGEWMIHFSHSNRTSHYQNTLILEDFGGGGLTWKFEFGFLFRFLQSSVLTSEVSSQSRAFSLALMRLSEINKTYWSDTIKILEIWNSGNRNCVSHTINSKYARHVVVLPIVGWRQLPINCWCDPR